MSLRFTISDYWFAASATLIGISEFAERQADWRSKLSALDDGFLRRVLFVRLRNETGGSYGK